MSVAGVFADLAQGRAPADAGLLGNCRLEWGGGEAYGEEAVLASFRRAPLAIDGGVIETPVAAAWMGDRAALVADLYDGRVGRLWRLGEGAAPAPEPAVAVAADPDLRQQRGDVYFRAADHPALDPAAADAVIAAGRALLEPAAGTHRARAFVLRAFSAGGATVALFALHRLGGEAVRTSGFVRTVAAIAADGSVRTVIDQTPRTDWTPRL